MAIILIIVYLSYIRKNKVNITNNRPSFNNPAYDIVTDNFGSDTYSTFNNKDDENLFLDDDYHDGILYSDSQTQIDNQLELETTQSIECNFGGSTDDSLSIDDSNSDNTKSYDNAYDFADYEVPESTNGYLNIN